MNQSTMIAPPCLHKTFETTLAKTFPGRDDLQDLARLTFYKDGFTPRIESYDNVSDADFERIAAFLDAAWTTMLDVETARNRGVTRPEYPHEAFEADLFEHFSNREDIQDLARTLFYEDFDSRVMTYGRISNEELKLIGRFFVPYVTPS